jgi:ribose 5-phosphate isomerase A
VSAKGEERGAADAAEALAADAAERLAADRQKQRAAEAAAELVEDGMVLGLGTGSTVAFLLPAIASRGVDVRCVATSPRTEDAARALGLRVESFAGLDAPARLDLVIDGADQVAPSGWVVKGGGAAHTREKAVAAAADRFVVIVSAEKLVERLGPPVPVELLEFGLAATLRRLEHVRLRDVARSPDGGVIADYIGAFDDPAVLSEWLANEPGVVEHGLFPASMVSEVIVGTAAGVVRRPT